MNSSSPSASSTASASPKVSQTNNKDPGELITINEKVNLTKNQYEVLQIVCSSYEMTISEYMQEALVEAIRFDIEEGNFSNVLLEKLGEGNGKKKTDFTQPSSMIDELDKLHKQQMSY